MKNPWRGLKGLPNRIWILCATTLINRAGTMVLPFLVLYLTNELHFSASRAGFILMLYGIGAMFAAPIAGRFSDRYGAALILRASLICSGVMLLIFPLAESFGAVVCATLALSVTTEMFRPANLAFISHAVPPEKRKSAFALNRLTINLGMSIGPALGGFLAVFSFRYLFLIDGITSLIAGVILVMTSLKTVEEVSETEEQATVTPIDLTSNPAWKDHIFVYYWFALIPVILVFFQHISAMPLFLVRNLHLSEASYGISFTVNTLLVIFLEVPLMQAISHWKFRDSLSFACLLIGIGFGSLMLSSGFTGVLITVVIWTFGEMILFPISSAFVAHLAPRARQGEYMGLYTMAFSVGFAIGPGSGAYLLEKWGGATLWSIMFVLGAISAAAMLRLPKEH